jgi:hypothetical protein
VIRPTDFIPAAYSLEDVPAGYRRVSRTWISKYGPEISPTDTVGKVVEVGKNWDIIRKRGREAFKPLPWWHRIYR